MTRAEAWSFFDPPSGGGDASYAFFGNRGTLGVRVNARRIEFQGSFQYAQLLGLPRTASGPGPLGPGASFFNAARDSKAYQLYFKSMSLRVKDVVPGLSLEAGRMAYESGEGTRAAGRLVGNAEWTMFERAFDGVRLDYERERWRAHVAFVMPTQGAFEESANPTMPDVRVATASWTRGGVQVFAHHYRDTRWVASRPDNTGQRAAAVDVRVQTVGGYYERSAGRFGLRFWGALQGGDWYGDGHRAVSGLAEVSHGWPSARWRPALTGGMLYASGDDDPNDRRHATFFPMLPTTRPDVLAGTYAQMNLRDIYAEATVHPGDRLTLSGQVHRLSLAQALDRWYSGTGATAFDGSYFGYSSRSSRLRTGLGTFVQLSAEAPLKKYWTVKATAGIVKGGDVARRQFAGDWITVFVAQSTVAIR